MPGFRLILSSEGTVVYVSTEENKKFIDDIITSNTMFSSNRKQSEFITVKLLTEE